MHNIPNIFKIQTIPITGANLCALFWTCTTRAFQIVSWNSWAWVRMCAYVHHYYVRLCLCDLLCVRYPSAFLLCVYFAITTSPYFRFSVWWSVKRKTHTHRHALTRSANACASTFRHCQRDSERTCGNIAPSTSGVRKCEVPHNAVPCSVPLSGRNGVRKHNEGQTIELEGMFVPLRRNCRHPPGQCIVVVFVLMTLVHCLETRIRQTAQNRYVRVWKAHRAP